MNDYDKFMWGEGDIELLEERDTEEVAKPREYSSTQVQLTGPALKSVQAACQQLQDIAPDLLAGDGLETDPHITVKFGLHTNDAEDVARLVKGFGPVQATIGKTSIFDNSDKGEEVLKLDVESDDLHRLNETIAKLPHTDTHPTYKPHVTLGYFKPGTAEENGWIGLEVVPAGVEITFTELVFSDKDGNKTTIPLGTRGE